ncbi:hypothetical protein Q5P01_007814 [Channa striata]|uniref:Uncharacterized protein n=1 Tax=Channa striata TaxID=64152 RepID=A0AA88N5F5_CHASR|nr:hypothetical protein Q5P01_007814 [Channa striata]
MRSNYERWRRASCCSPQDEGSSAVDELPDYVATRLFPKRLEKSISNQANVNRSVLEKDKACAPSAVILCERMLHSRPDSSVEFIEQRA